MTRIIFTAILAVCLFGCAKEQAVIPNNIIVAVDLSGSRDSLAQVRYRDLIETIVLPQLGMHDRITVLPIDNGSQTATQEIFAKNFGLNNYSNEFAGFNSAENEQRWHQDSVAAAVREFDASFSAIIKDRAALRAGTDIMGALRVAKKYYVPAARNLLMCLSDMQQSSGGVEFAKPLAEEQPTGQRIQLPVTDLAGFDLIVVTGREDNTDVNKYLAIETFWTRYFEYSKAHLVDYSSGSTAKVIEWFGTKSFDHE